MEITQKADLIAEKLNKITSSFSDQLDNASNLIVMGNELSSEATDVIQDIKALPVSESSDKTYTFNLDLLPQILNLETMVSDISYIRSTLKKNCDLGQRLLLTMSQELEFEPNAELLASYSELSKTITENMKLYLACYKDVSNILINISKLVQSQNKESKEEGKIVNNITIGSDPKIQNTAELIKQLAKLNK